MKIICSFFFLLSACAAAFAQKALSVIQLRCEYRDNPIGVVAPHPALSWELRSSGRNIVQRAYRILVADDSSLLQNNNGNVWDSQQVDSDASIQVPFGGNTLMPVKKYYWKVKVWDNTGHVSGWSRTASWQMGLPNAADWHGAKWIGYAVLPGSSRIVPFVHGKGKKEWGAREDVLPLLRKTFSIDKPVKRATVFVSGLGQFDLHINGAKVGDDFLDPGWTQYDKQALYVGFDITKQVKPGKNAVGIMLGNGFYYIPGERYRKLTGGFGYPCLLVRLVLDYADGSSKDLVSDESWKAAPSPVVFSSEYGGEDYDAGKLQPDWDMPGFKDLEWQNAVLAPGPMQLDPQLAAPVKRMQVFKPVTVKQLKPNVLIYDFGQNCSGIPFIKVKGSRADTVRITPGELLNADGSVNQKNSGSPCYFTYICKGAGNEQWHPQFSYYGFRYLQVQISGKPNSTPASIKNMEAWHLRNAAQTAGEFSCSKELFNKTFTLINWAIKSNMMSLFTDCPHREKLGWLEQMHLMGSSVQYNFDIAALCRKIISDMKYAQTAEGLVPEIAPEYVHFDEPFRDSPEWGSAAIILPWYNYQWYADKQTLADAYDMMKRYIAYLDHSSTDHILSQGLGDWYDIGPNPPGESQLTPKGVTATATFYYDLTIMQQVAGLLDKPGDVKEYARMAGEVKEAFNRKFYNPATAQYATGSQAANAMALFMNLVEEDNKKAVADNLVKDIQSRHNALTGGDIGYRYVLRALEDAGRSDVIFDMNNGSDVPGYGYQLAHGATALTESWQAYPTVSNNHFMLGHLMEWFYAGLCGIKQADGSVGYKHIVIKPQPAGDIRFANASYHCPYGWIRSSWRIHNGRFALQVDIPANTDATVFLPGAGKPVQLGSGKYTYVVKWN